ncbi:MAG: heme lyase NrfEFG subunit NrfE, partial [Caulobacteraceae bacterium]|nr:heme lyase NrfEFG subunit NrfE [Caulobacteraceae bacterium]
LAGTLWPLVLEAMGRQGGVGAPYYNLVVGSLMAVAFLILPLAPLTPWRRGDLAGVAGQLGPAAVFGLAVAGLALILEQPRQALAAAQVGLGGWVAAGTVAEAFRRGGDGAVRARLGRLAAWPRGSWGMSLAHLGLGLFIAGAAFESAWKSEAAAVLSPGMSVMLAGRKLTLSDVHEQPGPNYDAERARFSLTDARGRVVCRPAPERRTFAVGGDTTSKVAICPLGLDDAYVVLADRREGAGGAPAWLVRAYWNPLVRLIFLGPVLMAAGGALSLSDRRLRRMERRRPRPSASFAAAE